MGFIEEDFSELADTIRAHRMTDLELDGICQDYELLKNDLGKVAADGSNPDPQWQVELQIVLTELKSEILSKIGAGK